MPYGYGSANRRGPSGPGPGGQGARGQATQNPGRAPTPTYQNVHQTGAVTQTPGRPPTTVTTAAGPPRVLNPPRGITQSNKFKKFLSNINFRHGKGIRDLRNYASIPATYFAGMLPGKLGDWATGMMRTDEMDENLANLINQKMTTGPTFDDLSGNISYSDYGLPQSYDLKPTYDTEGRIEKWTKEPSTRFKAPSLKEMATMNSADLANALTVGNVGYSKDTNTGKMSYTGTEYDDLASKIFDARPAKIPLNLNLANGGLIDFYRYGGFI